MAQKFYLFVLKHKQKTTDQIALCIVNLHFKLFGHHNLLRLSSVFLLLVSQNPEQITETPIKRSKICPFYEIFLQLTYLTDRRFKKHRSHLCFQNKCQSKQKHSQAVFNSFNGSVGIDFGRI